MNTTLKMEFIRRMLDTRDRMLAEKEEIEKSFWKFLPWKKQRLKVLDAHLTLLDRKLFKNKKEDH